MKANKPFEFFSTYFPAKNERTIFPNEFFHKIWLINKECKYNYIAVKELKKKILGYDLGTKQVLNSALNLLIFAK